MADTNARWERTVRKVAMLGNHLPRQCGIATFTTDLSDAISLARPEIDCFVLAMNDPGVRHAYPPRVRFEIAEGDVAAYRRGAEFLNVSAADVVSLQHEYGIFGPRAGANVLELLRGLRMPVVSTLHTIIADPSPVQRGVLEAILAVSERVVVMSDDGARLLREVHRVDAAKIDVIPHGIPSAPANLDRSRLGVEGGAVILTFGLLSPDKGIEHVIDAMPEIVARHPNTVYIVLGATHPHVKAQHGEIYRLMLERRAERLGVGENVVFHNRFVSHDELVEFLGAADIYVTPYLNEAQSTSGTLAYAVGAGKAVISTPYRYARELLGDGRGLLVPPKDSKAIAREIVGLLDDPEKRKALEARAATFGRNMSWPIVAQRYVDSFERAKSSHEERRRRGAQARALAPRSPELPEVNLAHLCTMTDDTGMLQHAAFNVPRYSDGYCTDDNARALLLMTLVEEEGTAAPALVRQYASRYLAFVNHALDAGGRFRNFMTYSRQWLDERGSDDCHGRALWALGTVVGRSSDFGRQRLANSLFQSALAASETLKSPRAWAYSLLGIGEYLRAYSGDSRVRAVAASLANQLLLRLAHSRTEAWPWFEDRLTYCNARLPQALLVTGDWMKDEAMVGEGLRSLGWLLEQYAGPGGVFAPVGTNGFYVRGGERARFDQQPVEASAAVSACLEAHRLTNQPQWAAHARHAFEWFFDQNVLRAPLFDATTGGCRDGIHTDRLNENQGAESTLSFLLATAEMRASDRLATKLVATQAQRLRAPAVVDGSSS